MRHVKLVIAMLTNVNLGHGMLTNVNLGNTGLGYALLLIIMVALRLCNTFLLIQRRAIRLHRV